LTFPKAHRLTLCLSGPTCRAIWPLASGRANGYVAATARFRMECSPMTTRHNKCTYIMATQMKQAIALPDPHAIMQIVGIPTAIL
jgi:hypothetical protein